MFYLFIILQTCELSYAKIFLQNSSRWLLMLYCTLCSVQDSTVVKSDFLVTTYQTVFIQYSIVQYCIQYSMHVW